ncbi:MAG: hypothetical protein GQ531_08385 [Sulfurovum sp.]|nr:hypothetical protein [Sulfurovum sp.]
MIAYDYNIHYVPEIPLAKTSKISLKNTITIKHSTHLAWEEPLAYKWPFYNNQGRDITLFTERAFTRTEKEQLWVFDIEDVMTFFWKSGTLTLEYVPQKNFTQYLLQYWSLHIVLPLLLSIEEKYDFLHAGAVEVGNRPILFVAESFGGKSTLTDFFMKQGHTMISDDKVAVYEENNAFLAVPSHPYHRPHRKMEDLGYFVDNVATSPEAIRVIYELERADPTADIYIRELNGIEKFKSLRYSSEINLSFLKTKRFIFLTHLAKVVPVYKITVPWDIERLPEVYNTIVRHCKTIQVSEE